MFIIAVNTFYHEGQLPGICWGREIVSNVSVVSVVAIVTGISMLEVRKGCAVCTLRGRQGRRKRPYHPSSATPAPTLISKQALIREYLRMGENAREVFLTTELSNSRSERLSLHRSALALQQTRCAFRELYGYSV